MPAMSQHPACSRVSVWTAALCALQLMASAPARACSCRVTTAVLWPTAGTSVSADTAIVIEAAPGSAFASYDVTLRGPDGKALELKEAQRLPRTFSCDGELVFLRPEPELKPGMKYEVTIKTEESNTKLVKFATRESSERPKAAAKPDITYLHVAEHPECEGGACYPVAEVRVELEHALHELTWLLIRSGAESSQVNRWEFSPDAWLRIPFGDPADKPEEPERVVQLSVPLPPEDPCVDIAIYGIDGSALYEERRCQPDRCAVHQNRQATSCGEPARTGLDATRLSPASCDDPPVFEDHLDFAYPKFDAGTQDAREQDEHEPVRLRTRPAPTCHVAPLSAASSAPWARALIACVGLLLLRRRQRWS